MPAISANATITATPRTRPNVAPSDALRRWFGHDPARWEEFQRRYFAELDAKPETWRPILERAPTETVTLVYAARDAEHNNAVALNRFLKPRVRRKGKAPSAKKP